MNKYKDVTERYKYTLNSINLDFDSSLNKGYFDLKLRHDKIVNKNLYSLIMMKKLNDLCIGIAGGRIKIMEVNDNEK